MSLYSSNLNGFTKSEFHRIVGDKDNVLYLVKTEEYNRTFGGFYSVRFKSVSDDNYIRDEKAFILQLDE